MIDVQAVAQVLAQSRWDGHMWGWGAGFWVAAIMVVLWALVAWLVVALARGGAGNGSRPTAEPLDRAKALLADRLARGEIDASEYRHCLDALLG